MANWFPNGALPDGARIEVEQRPADPRLAANAQPVSDKNLPSPKFDKYAGLQSDITLDDWHFKLNVFFAGNRVTGDFQQVCIAVLHTDGAAATFLRGVSRKSANALPYNTMLDLYTALKNRFDPRHEELAADVALMRINQRDNESLADYIERFSDSAAHSTLPDSSLCTAFVGGLLDQNLRKDLLDAVRAGNVTDLLDQATFKSRADNPFKNGKRQRDNESKTDDKRKHFKPHRYNKYGGRDFRRHGGRNGRNQRFDHGGRFHQRQQQQQSNGNNNGNGDRHNGNNGQKGVKCFRCGQFGHIAPNCQNRPAAPARVNALSNIERDLIELRAELRYKDQLMAHLGVAPIQQQQPSQQQQQPPSNQQPSNYGGHRSVQRTN